MEASHPRRRRGQAEGVASTRHSPDDAGGTSGQHDKAAGADPPLIPYYRERVAETDTNGLIQSNDEKDGYSRLE